MKLSELRDRFNAILAKFPDIDVILASADGPHEVEAVAEVVIGSDQNDGTRVGPGVAFVCDERGGERVKHMNEHHAREMAIWVAARANRNGQDLNVNNWKHVTSPQGMNRINLAPDDAATAEKINQYAWTRAGKYGVQ